MSKLYTEEQLRQVCQFVRGKNVDEFIASLTPIELPSDEEIDDESKIGGMDTAQKLCFQLGAKWMRDKIKGGEDEN